jgi:hypothetical protein
MRSAPAAVSVFKMVSFSGGGLMNKVKAKALAPA